MSSDLQAIQKDRIRNIFKINTKQIVEAILDSDKQIEIYDNAFSKNDVTRAFNKVYKREKNILSGITNYNTKTTLANELGTIDEERIKIVFEYNESKPILSEEALVHLYLRSTYYNEDYNKTAMDYFNKQDLSKRTRLFFASILQPFTGDKQLTKRNDSKLLLLLHRGYNLNFFSTLYDDDEAYAIADWVSEYMPNSQSNYLIQNKIKELRKSEGKKEEALFLERKECLTPMCEVPPTYFKADKMLEFDRKANEAIADFKASTWSNNKTDDKIKEITYEDMIQKGRQARNLKEKKDVQSLYQELIYENHNKVTFKKTTFKLTRLFQAFPFRYFGKTESTDLESRNYIERFDGEIGYTTFNGQITEYDTKKRKTYKDREHFIKEFIEEDNVTVDSRKLKATFQCEVDGISYYGFEFKVRGNDEIDKEIEYFNVETGLHKRTEYFNNEVMSHASTNTYDAFNGILFPTKIEGENNFILQTAQAIKTEVNQEYDTAIFE
ncbi:MAG TPA: hypothetical protein DEG69_03460 [Flavobacteriaceae bacterium]|nr:hypothetical protein [Flavobacteriaceae bacterium]